MIEDVLVLLAHLVHGPVISSGKGTRSPQQGRSRRHKHSRGGSMAELSKLFSMNFGGVESPIMSFSASVRGDRADAYR